MVIGTIVDFSASLGTACAAPELAALETQERIHGPIRKIVPSGDVLVVGAENLHVVDISTPSTPATLATIPAGEYSDFAVSGRTVAVVSRSGDLAIYSIESLKWPRLVSQLGLGLNDPAVALGVGHAYVADRSGLLKIVGLSSRNAPQIVGHLSLPSGVNTIHLSGQVLFLGSDRVLCGVDISDHANPRLAATAQEDCSRGIVTSGATAFLLSGDCSVGSASLVSDELGVRFHDYDSTCLSGEGAGLAFGGSLIFRVSSFGRLSVIDARGGAKLAEIGHLDVRGNDGGLAVEDGVAYVGSVLGLHVVDLTNPAQPIEIGLVPSDASVDQIVLAKCIDLGRTDYPKAREIVRRMGWVPIPGEGENYEGGTVGRYRAIGWSECDDCSGTGLGFCIFRFRRPDSTEVLNIVTTEGYGSREDAPVVHHWWIHD